MAAAFYLAVFLTISFVRADPIEYPTEYPTDFPPTDPPDPRCAAEFWSDQTGFVCNDDKTGYYFCFYDGELQKEVICPSGRRCRCSGGHKCYKDSKDRKIPPTSESSICEYIPPPIRPLPDPVLLTYKDVYKQVTEANEEDGGISQTSSEEIRQDIKNGKYMRIYRDSADFYLVVGQTSYAGNLEQKTCKISHIGRLPSYLTRDHFLSGYTLHRESVDGAVTSQTWTKPGTYHYDPVEYFWVTVKDGYTLLVQYSYSEGRDPEDAGTLVSSDHDIYYKTTYGVDSSHWFDVPSFCL